MKRFDLALLGKVAIAISVVAPPLVTLHPPDFADCRLQVTRDLDGKVWARCPETDCDPFPGECSYTFQSINGATFHGCSCGGNSSELCRGWARNLSWDEDDVICINDCPTTVPICEEDLTPPAWPAWGDACRCVPPPTM